MTHSLLVRPIARKEWAATSVVAFFFIVLMPLLLRTAQRFDGYAAP